MPGFFQRPISPQLSPNVEGRDLWFVLSRLLNPVAWLFWQRGAAGQRLEQYFKDRFQVGFARSFQSGRAALRVILEGLGLPQDSEIIIQAFTCIVVPEAVLAAGLKPVYVDIDQSYNIDPQSLRELLKQHPRAKGVVVQHTFGYPAEMEEIQQICQEQDLFLVEDCAHALGATIGGREVGTFGQAAMFSFGRDKVISAVSGGVAITNDPQLGAAMNRSWRAARYPRLGWVAQRLIHPLSFAVGKRLYYVAGLGKLIIHLSRTLRLWPVVLTPGERQGRPDPIVHKLPNVLAAWTLDQLDRLPRFQAHRTELAQVYAAGLKPVLPKAALVESLPKTVPIFLRYPIQVADQKAVLKALRSAGILLGDWYTQPVMPCDVDLTVVGYQAGSCPRAEQAAATVVNLPTNVAVKRSDAEKIVKLITERLKPHGH